MLWETGYAENHVMENLHCSYDNGTCYEVKTVPVIFDISTTSGYRTGGQNLTLYGNGLQVGTANVLVDGVDCLVTAQSNEHLSCTIGEKASASNLTAPHIGHHGLRRHTINSTENTTKLWI